MSKYVAIDFEHATRTKGSICSVGIVTFENHMITDEFQALIKPPNNEFEWFTTKVHGINSYITRDSPNFLNVYPEIKRRIEGNTLVAHGAFHTEIHCLEQAMDHYSIYDQLDIQWECTHRITGTNLNTVCDSIGIELNHHDSLSDARACGLIYSLYLKNELDTSYIRVNNSTKSTRIRQSSERLSGDVLKPDFENVTDKENIFFKKKVVLTGLPIDIKKDLAQKLKLLGADIDTGVTKKTNFLIFGGNAGPSKLKKMEANIQEGREASIIPIEDIPSMLA